MATGDISAITEAVGYDPATGALTWLRSSGSRKAGDVASSVNSLGYGRVKIGGKTYGAHRVAWALHHGAMPASHLDHINGVKTDNRIANLRLATRAENQQNRATPKHNTSGHKGVNWNSTAGKWAARCMREGKRVHIGYFDDIAAAVSAYQRTASSLHGAFYKGV